MKTRKICLCVSILVTFFLLKPLQAFGAKDAYADAHFHISNYAYQGVSLKNLVRHYLGGKIVRSTVMPLPLQQKWDPFEHYADDKIVPNYYMGPKAELYYYAFADAMIAKEFQTLSQREKAMLDPMITGFNPMDAYAAQHIKRALLTFPGVFSGIGEFTVHKEIVSGKIAGDPLRYTAKGSLPVDIGKGGKMTLYSPALKDILDVVAETGLVATLHNDIYETEVKYDGSKVKKNPKAIYTDGLIHLCQESPRATVIWAHTGLGRFVKPTARHLELVSRVMEACPRWSVDISWDLVQKNIVSPDVDMPALEAWTHFIQKYQDRVLWGSDTVIYSRNKLDDAGAAKKGERMSVRDYEAVADVLKPLWDSLTPEVSAKVKRGNYTRLFDAARRQVRSWEKAHARDDVWDLRTP